VESHSKFDKNQLQVSVPFWMYALLGLIALLGIGVMIGWYAKIQLLVEWLPGSVAMQFNTALCFFLSATGLYFQLRNKDNYKVAKIMGGLVFMVAGLTVIQYLFGLNMYLDELFVKHWLTEHVTHPGRMAATTGLAFLIFSSTLFLGSPSRQNTLLQLICSLFTVQVLLLGLISFLGYLFGVEEKFGRIYITRMAIHTTIGFILLGGVSLIYRIRYFQKTSFPKVWRFPLIIGQSICLLAVILWNNSKDEFAEERIIVMQSVQNAIHQNIQRGIKQRTDALIRHMKRVQLLKDNGVDRSGLAEGLLNDYSGFEGLVWSQSSSFAPPPRR